MRPCDWCPEGTTHDGVCPRVEAMTFHPDGSLQGVSFHPDTTSPSAVDYLESIDPGWLNDVASDLIGVEGDTFGECALAALKAHARGNL